MKTGTIISGIGHVGLIIWVLFAGLFSSHDDLPQVAVTEVSLLTSAEFDAMIAQTPSVPDPAPEPVISAPEPVQPEPLQPEPVQPEPEASEPAPRPQAEVVETLPEPPAPIAEVAQPIPAPDTSARPKPREAPRVAPLPAEAPEPDAQVAETPTPAAAPEPQPDAEVVQEEKPEAAPEEATTEIVTEATETEDKPALAPTSSTRPRPKPAKAPAPADDAMAAAVAAAVAEAASDSPAPAEITAPAAPSGPPLTAGEKDALRVSVQQCWNVGSLSSEALRVTVTIALTVAQSGVPDAASIRMLGFEGGTEAAARQAFEAARRAVIRCGSTGFKLPVEKYEQWRNIEMVFNPERMRIK